MASDAGQAPDLPSWLAEPSAYVPASDRDGFLRKNILSITSALTVLRNEPRTQEGVERAFAGVRSGLRLLGTLVLIICVSLSSNAAFVWAVLAAWLVLVALHPAHAMRVLVAAPVVAAAFAFVVNLPAALLGQAAAPVRMAAKTLVTVGLATNLSHALGSAGLLRALRELHAPQALVTTVDLAIRDIVLLGESAATLSEALALRSVGHDHHKTASAAGVMGTTFLRAQRMAAARAEAMELRGYGTGVSMRPPRGKLGVADVAYAALIVLAAVLFVYLEVSMP